jgi:LPXTG-motif cell wall-anchored protein
MKHPTRFSAFTCIATASVLLLVAYAWSATPTWSTRIELSTQVDRVSVPQDESVRFTVKVQWHGPAELFRVAWPQAPQVTKLDVSGSARGTEVISSATGQTTIQEFSYILRPKEIGTASIGGVQITYISMIDTANVARELSTRPLEITITRPIHGESGVNWPMIAGIVAFVVGVGGFVISKRRRKGSNDEPEAETTDELADIRDRMNTARDERNMPAFYGHLLDALRTIFARKLHVETHDLQPAGLIALIDEHRWPDDERKDKTHALLESIDRHRFAPVEPEQWRLDEAETLITDLSAWT